MFALLDQLCITPSRGPSFRLYQYVFALQQRFRSQQLRPTRGHRKLSIRQRSYSSQSFLRQATTDDDGRDALAFAPAGGVELARPLLMGPAYCGALLPPAISVAPRACKVARMGRERESFLWAHSFGELESWLWSALTVRWRRASWHCYSLLVSGFEDNPCSPRLALTATHASGAAARTREVILVNTTGGLGAPAPYLRS